MNFNRMTIVCLAAMLAACAQQPTQSAAEEVPHKVSRDYEAVGESSGIRPYVYGKNTLIKLDAGKPAFMSIKDEQGTYVGYKTQGDYYVLDRKLDSFTVTGLGRSVRFNRIYPEATIETADNTMDSVNELEPEVLPACDNSDALADADRKIKFSDPLYAIMYDQMQQQRRLFNIASANPNYTGEELFQINSRLDLIEYKISRQDEAIVHVYFPFNNTVFNPEPELVKALLPVAKDAIRINIYGRTDSKIPDKGNNQIAQGRVIAAKEFLVKHGIPENTIYTSFLASGDFIAPAGMEEGRSLNRRVTIEVVTQ